MVASWKPEFEQLLLKVSIGKLALHFIDELQAFYERFEGKDEYEAVKVDCDCLISLIYYYQELDEKSFEIDLRLLKENPPDHYAYYDIIGRAAKTSEHLERAQEVIPYVVAFLKTPDDHVEKKRFVLGWYVRLFPEQADEFSSSFAHILLNMEATVGKKTDHSLPFSDQVNSLNDELNRADTAFSEFAMAFGKAVKEDRDKLIKDYLATEDLEYYRDRVKQRYQK